MGDGGGRGEDGGGGFLTALTWLGVLVLVAVGIAFASGIGRQRPVYYAYADGHGAVAYVESLQEVPARYRASARTMVLPAPKIEDELATRWRRLRERVTPDDTTAASAKAGADGKAPAASDGASAVRDPNRTWIREATEDYPALYTTGLIIAVLVLATPLAWKSMDPDKWNRVLGWAVPLFLVLGGLAHFSSAMQRGDRGVHALLEGGKAAAPPSSGPILLPTAPGAPTSSARSVYEP